MTDNPSSADLVLYNGRVLTVDPGFSVASAVAVRRGVIETVGPDQVVLSLVSPTTQRIDLQGRTVLPGFIDTHNHMLDAGLGLERVNLFSARRIDDVQRALAAKASAVPEGTWLLSTGWHPLAQLEERRFPTREELDEACPRYPAFLVTVGHFAIANSLALAAAGIGPETPDPPGGIVHRDPKTGVPTGVLEETAISLLTRALPRPSRDEMTEALRAIMRRYNETGLTGVIDPGIGPEHWGAYQELRSRGAMTIRTAAYYRLDPTLAESELEAALKSLGIFSGFGNSWLSLDGIKLVMDGGMTLRTAFMGRPYPHEASYRGTQAIPTDRFRWIVRAANHAGWRVHVHAVGDAAIDLVLDGFEEADRERPIGERRFSVIHGSLATPDQMERMRRLNLLVPIQTLFMHDKAMTVVRHLGEEVARRAVPARWYRDHGVLLGGGSDHTVNPYPPLVGIWHAVSRTVPGGNDLCAEQRLSREEAIRLYTSWAAAFTFEEGSRGSIEPGKLADLVVLDRDILAVAEDEIKDLNVELTIVGGRVVFERKWP